jgi:uncharacterized protein (DUF1697 family)
MGVMVVLLRGINLGANNRIAMPALREALAGAGMPDARTYVQSGNIVLDSPLSSERLEDAVEKLIADRFGLAIPVVARTRDELAAVVAGNPLAEVATDPKRYQVSFLSEALDPAALAAIEAKVVEPERLVAAGRELYAWHPNGVARSKLALGLGDRKLGVTASARNWKTVTTLLEMADER